MMKSTLYNILIACLFLGMISVPADDCFADEVYMELISWKYADGKRELVAVMTAYDDDGNEYFPSGALVNFLYMNDGEETSLGNAASGNDGKAIFSLDPANKIFMDEEGYMQFLARLVESEKFDPAEAELSIKDARLEIDFVVEEDERTILYKGFVTSADGEEGPLMDDDCYLFVPTMFNDMKIEDGWLEEDGTGRMVFPNDLIGDSTGNIEVIARIEEHYDYGNLEARGNSTWALSKHDERREGPVRELWTPIAPLWMIITLIILLAGVWGHYTYAVIQLIKIKKAGRRAKQAS